MTRTHIAFAAVTLLVSLSSLQAETNDINAGIMADCTPVTGLCQDLKLFLNEAANGNNKAAKAFSDKIKQEYKETVASDIRGRAQDFKRLAEFFRKQNAQKALAVLKQLGEEAEPYFEARNAKWETRRKNK